MDIVKRIDQLIEHLHDEGFSLHESPCTDMELAKRELAALRDDRDRLVAERDALIAAWPDDIEVPTGISAPPQRYVWNARQDEWYYEPGMKGPYPSREAAVRAAAGLDSAEGGET